MDLRKKIVLVFPAAESRRPVSLDRNFPPMGITKIATRLKRFAPELNIVLIDEAYQQVPSLDPGDVVGISCTAVNSRRSSDIAKLAKRSGAHVILGGPHATHRAKQALDNTPADQVVKRHGEEAFAEIILNGRKDRIINGSVSCGILPEPLPDLTLWKSLVPYEQVFERSIWSRDYVDGFFLETQRGCSQKPRCSYCVRGPSGVLKIENRRFWEIISEIRGARLDGRESSRVPARVQVLGSCRGGRRLYRETDGKMLIFDFSDEFLAMGKERIENLRILAESMPEELRGKIEFLTYARPDQINSPEIAELLKKAGVSKVSLGIESGTDETLIRLNRKMTLDDHRRAVKLLSDAGIQIYVNFLLGCIGETQETMEKTVEHFKELVEIAKGMVYRAGARIIVPFPGSLDFRRLVRNLREKGEETKARMYEESFVMEPAMLEADWLDHCTDVLMDDVLDAHAEMMEIARKNSIGMSDRPHLS